MRLVRAGDDEQAGGVAVEPVDDPRPVLVAAGHVVSEQAVHERPALVARPGMNDDAGRLVDDEQVLVLPDDVEIHLLGLERAGLGGELDDDLLPALEPVALRPRLAVDEDGAVGDQPLGERPRADLGPACDGPVEPLGLRGEKAESGQRCRRPALGAVAARERAEEGRDADDDEDVGEVERGPEAEVEEVGDVAEPHAVEQVAEAAAEHEPERHRQHRVPAAGAREEDQHPRRRRSR